MSNVSVYADDGTPPVLSDWEGRVARPGFTRIALVFTYHGASFHGWQKQPNLDTMATLQGALETALARMAGHAVTAIPAGRTDRGVHALRQIVHFDTDAVRPLGAWVKGVNAHLPPSVRILSAQTMAADFHARYSAVSRSYRYVLYRSPTRLPHIADTAGWVFQNLDVAAMHEAAQVLVGEHDFSSFRGADCQARTPVRELYRAEVYEDNGMICCDFTANAFLHHMIRNFMGALIKTGTGKLTAQELAAILTARDRRAAPPTFQAAGLYFLRADYPPCYLLPLPPLPAWFWGKRDV